MSANDTRTDQDRGVAGAAPAAVDWETVARWDQAYYLHALPTPEEGAWRAVAAQEGNYLEMADGARLLDFESQLASANLGHRHPRIVAAIEEALGRYGQVHFNWATDYRARAAKLIVEDLLGEEGWAARFRLLSSGTNAMDTALAMARLYTGRERVVTQRHSFHGLHPYSGTTFRGYRSQLSSPTRIGDVRDVPGYPAHGFLEVPAHERSDEGGAGTLASIAELQRVIEDAGPEIAAVVTEPMLTAAGIMSHPDYARQLRELTAAYGILWIDDEVICGFGRLGRWFGYQLANGGPSPDLMVIGKGMNSCTVPVGGVVMSAPVAARFESSRWFNGSTWDGHPIVAASVVATIEAMLDEGLVAAAPRRGARLEAGLRELAARHPVVERVDGAGLCWAVDVAGAHDDPRLAASDRAFDFTGDYSAAPSRLIGRVAAEHGVFLVGFLPRTIRFAPPLTITDAEIDQGLAAFAAGLQALEDAEAAA